MSKREGTKQTCMRTCHRQLRRGFGLLDRGIERLKDSGWTDSTLLPTPPGRGAAHGFVGPSLCNAASPTVRISKRQNAQHARVHCNQRPSGIRFLRRAGGRFRVVKKMEGVSHTTTLPCWWN